jgi:hypothetical protein
VFLARYSSFGINLLKGGEQSGLARVTADSTHDLSIKEVLAHHDRIDRRGVVECKERETSGTTSRVSHDRAGVYFAKLGEVLSE